MKKFWGVSLLLLCMPTFALAASSDMAKQYATTKGCTFTFSENGKTSTIKNVGRAMFDTIGRGNAELWHSDGTQIKDIPEFTNSDGFIDTPSWNNLKSINGARVNKSISSGAMGIYFNCDKLSTNNGFAVKCNNVEDAVGNKELTKGYYDKCIKRHPKVSPAVKKQLKDPHSQSQTPPVQDASIDSFEFRFKNGIISTEIAKAFFLSNGTGRMYYTRNGVFKALPTGTDLVSIDNKPVDTKATAKELNAHMLIFNGTLYNKSNKKRLFVAICDNEHQGGKSLGIVRDWGLDKVESVEDGQHIYEKCINGSQQPATNKKQDNPKKQDKPKTKKPDDVKPGCRLEFESGYEYTDITSAMTVINDDGTVTAEYTDNKNKVIHTTKKDLNTYKLYDLYTIQDGENSFDVNNDVQGAKEIYFECAADNYIKIKSCRDGYTPQDEYPQRYSDAEPVYYKKCVKNTESAATEEPQEETPAPSDMREMFKNIDNMLNKHFEINGKNSSVWKNDQGKFNVARLASDSVAGVVLGTVSGVVTSHIVKKNQIKKGFEDLKCVINGQDIAEYNDVFTVTAY